MKSSSVTIEIKHVIKTIQHHLYRLQITQVALAVSFSQNWTVFVLVVLLPFSYFLYFEGLHLHPFFFSFWTSLVIIAFHLCVFEEEGRCYQFSRSRLAGHINPFFIPVFAEVYFLSVRDVSLELSCSDCGVQFQVWSFEEADQLL